MFDTHVFGTFRVIKTFVQPMIAQKRGSIINVCSGGGGGRTLEGPYQPAKAAEVMMTIFLANELKPHNIAANALLPGFTRTTGTDEQTAARGEVFARNNPGKPYLVRRLRPDSVVPLALHLAEQDANGITGETFEALAWNQQNELAGSKPGAMSRMCRRPERPVRCRATLESGKAYRQRHLLPAPVLLPQPAAGSIVIVRLVWSRRP